MINRNIIKSALFAVAVYLFVLFENKGLMVSEYEIKSDKISDRYDGLNIVQISDLQNCEFGHKNKYLLRKIKKLSPDAAVITGDIIDCHKTDVYSALDFVKQLRRICPVYYVCGNHEGVLGNYERLCGDLTENGAVVLNNESVYLNNDSKIRITGLKDPYFGESDNFGEFLSERINEDKDVFNIVLSHRPELFEAYVESGCDLVFAGHAHGGQIRLPFTGGLFSPNQGIFPKYTSGVHSKDGTEMVVSRGLGNSVFPLRVFNRPEIVSVILKKR